MVLGAHALRATRITFQGPGEGAKRHANKAWKTNTHVEADAWYAFPRPVITACGARRSK